MFYFKHNLSVIERLIRVALGICTAIAIAVLAPVLWAQIAAYAIVFTFSGTAIIGFCPVYALLGRKVE